MRILLIEDDEAINAGLKITLEKEGYAVDSFTDPIKGGRHATLNFQDYDLFIFDVMMPGKTGIEICSELRQQEISTPILMLTALSEPHDKVTALDSGADDYVTKPFSAEELVARTRALLRRPRQVQQPIISIGSLTLYPAEKKLIDQDGKEISITLKEFRILEYLVKFPNQVITRDKLLDHVWDIGFSSFSNVVEVHINSLRKKLKKYSSNGFIETVRGVGYRITL
jgi:DNA-binding response OmpR family regulator